MRVLGGVPGLRAGLRGPLLRPESSLCEVDALPELCRRGGGTQHDVNQRNNQRVQPAGLQKKRMQAASRAARRITSVSLSTLLVGEKSPPRLTK